MPKNRPNMQPVKVPTDLHQRMKIQAAIERATIQELTEKALLAYLDEHGIPDSWFEKGEEVHWIYPDGPVTFYIYRNAVGVEFCKIK